MVRFLCLSLVVSFLSACSGDTSSTRTSNPDRREQERYAHGSILGTRGGIRIFGSGGRNDQKPEIGVNAYLWRASLEVLSFAPLEKTDPHGGILETAWYDSEGKGQTRYRIAAYILQSKMTADALRVSVFKQEKQGGTWKDVSVSPKVASDFEDSIFERARALRQSKRSDA